MKWPDADVVADHRRMRAYIEAQLAAMLEAELLDELTYGPVVQRVPADQVRVVHRSPGAMITPQRIGPVRVF